MRSFVLLLIVIAMGGCATPTEREAKRIKAAATTAFNQANQCQAQIGQSSEWQELSAYLPPLDGGEPPMSLRINDNVPTAAQAALLVKLFNDRLLPCQTLAVADFQTVHPALAVAAAEFNAGANQAFARLAARQLTWGAYASLSATLKAEARGNWTKAAQKVEAEIEARLDADDRRRREIRSNAYNVWVTQTMLDQNAIALNQNQQLINRAYLPRMTNCTRSPHFISCTQF